MEDEHHGRCLAVPERVDDALVGLVRGVARNRELLEPALRHLLRAERAECNEEDPRADHEQAATMNDAAERGEHQAVLPAAARPGQIGTVTRPAGPTPQAPRAPREPVGGG